MKTTSSSSPFFAAQAINLFNAVFMMASALVALASIEAFCILMIVAIAWKTSPDENSRNRVASAASTNIHKLPLADQRVFRLRAA